MKDLRNIELPEGCRVVETTSERNGYPSHLRDAVIGFMNFEEAKAFASEHNLTLAWLEKKDGWRLYYRRELDVHEPMHLTPDDFGGTAYFEKDTKEVIGFLKEEIAEYCNSLSEIKKAVSKWEEIIEALEEKDDGEVVVTIDGEYYAAINPTCVEFSYDTWTTILGAVEI